MPRSLTAAICSVALIAVLGSIAPPARAHWCDTLWQSGYNVVVRPEADSVDVPTSGTTPLVVWVQNNMGYPLANFVLAASASGFNIQAPQLDASTRTLTGYLLPGEKQKYTLNVSRNGGTTLQAANLSFAMTFGVSSQSDGYGAPNAGRDAIVRLSDGSLAPGALPGLPSFSYQSQHLGRSAQVDYGDMAEGLDELFKGYCGGRGRWGTYDNGSGIFTCNFTSCPARVGGTGTSNIDWQRLWHSEFLAVRKAALATISGRTAAFRQRLICGSNDAVPAFAGMPLILLGYLGDDDTAHSHLETVASSGATSFEQAAAKAGLYVMGRTSDRDDRAYYRSDVTGGLASSDVWTRMFSAAALGLADFNDATVADHLIGNIAWSNPECSASPCDDGVGFTAAHLLDLVTWERRGWATGADDTGCGGYYAGCDTTPPDAPLNVTCTPGAGGTARIQWSQVSGASRYWVYWGSQQRTGGCVRPGTCAVDYSSSDDTTSIFYDVSGLTQGQRYYFAASAVDAAGNFSDYSAEVPCDIPVTPEPPLASLTCTPTSGTAPLDVSCDGTASSDPNNDIAYRYFSLDGGAEVNETDGLRDFADLPAGNHSVTLRVVDSGGRADSATVQIQVTAPVNNPPDVTSASVAPLSGPAPLTVNYSCSGCTDPDGNSIAYSWSFGDGSPDSNAASGQHTYAAPGRYSVTLGATDNGAPPLTSTRAFSVNATNQAPVATLTCTPTAGEAPLDVSCDGTASSDPNGAADLAGYAFNLDGQGWVDDADGIVSFPFASAGGHSIALRVTDQGGLAGTDTETIQVTTTGSLPPVAVISVDQASGYAPLTVSFDGSASHDDDGTIVEYEWNFGDGSPTESSDTAQHVYLADGSYTATLTVTDDDGLTGVATMVVSVSAAQHVPSAALTCTPASGGEPLDVTCDATGSSDSGGDIGHYLFSLNGGSDVDETDGSIGYTDLTAGNYTVSVRVVDGLGAEDVATASIQVSSAVNRAPTAVASADVVSGPAPLAVQFDSTGSSDPDGDALAFAWDFGDSSTVDHSAAPSHVFAADGTYRVTLTATDDGAPALSGTDVVVITVGAVTNHPPDVSTASASPLFGPAPLLVAFDGSGVRDEDGDAVTLTWDFGDSSTVSHQQSASHTYDHDGEFFATLTAVDDGQPPAESTRTFRIAVTDNRPPDVEAALVAPLTGPAPLAVTFDATPCTDPDGDAIRYRWDISIDSTEAITSASPTAQHTFGDPGQYAATLTLTDDGTPPLEVSKHFTVVVTYTETPPSAEVVKLVPQGCACRAATAPLSLVILGVCALFALTLVRRRR